MHADLRNSSPYNLFTSGESKHTDTHTHTMGLKYEGKNKQKYKKAVA